MLIVSPIITEAFFENFDKDTTRNYEWRKEGPPGKYSWNSTEKYVEITLADNSGIYLRKKIPAITEGIFQYKFFPTQTFPYNGQASIRLFSENENNGYLFVHPAGTYETVISKKVNGTTVSEKKLGEGKAKYSLNEWHTMKLKFGPGKVMGYMDDKEVLFISDPEIISRALPAVDRRTRTRLKI
jgi:hypothetical protein